MDARKQFVGLALSASLVSGAGIALGGSAEAGAQSRAAVSLQTTVSQERAMPGPAALSAGYGSVLNHAESVRLRGAAASTSTATAQLFPAWGTRLAVKAALQVVKRMSMATSKKIIGAAQAGRSAFMKVYAKLPDSVKAVFPSVAASALYDAVKWAVGL